MNKKDIKIIKKDEKWVCPRCPVNLCGCTFWEDEDTGMYTNGKVFFEV